MVIVEWAVAISLFWVVSALFLGGAPIRMENTGAFRELAGLLVAFAVFLVAWRLLVDALAGPLPSFAALVVGSLVASGLVPVIEIGTLRLFGTRVRRAEGATHH